MRISTLGFETTYFTKAEEWLEWCLEQIAPFAEGLRDLICERSEPVPDDEVRELIRKSRLTVGLVEVADDEFVRLAETNEVRRLDPSLHKAEKDQVAHASLMEQHLHSVTSSLSKLLRSGRAEPSAEELGWLVYYVFQAGRMSGLAEKDKVNLENLALRRRGGERAKEKANRRHLERAARVKELEKQGHGPTEAVQMVADQTGLHLGTIWESLKIAQELLRRNSGQHEELSTGAR